MEPMQNVVGWIEVPVENVALIIGSEGNRLALHSGK